MCGLADALLLGGATGKKDLENAVRQMCERMQVRGPDAELRLKIVITR